MASIRIKMVSICAMVVLIVMSVSGSIMLINVRNTEIDNSRIQLMDRARQVNEQIVQSFPPAEWIDEFDRHIPGGVHDIQGVVLDEIGVPIAPMELRSFSFSDQAVIAAITGGTGFSIGTRAPDLNGIEQEWIAFAMPVERDDTLYIVYTRMSARAMNDNLSQLTASIVMMVLIALIITVILWSVFANTLTGPIVGLTRQAKDMAQGHLDKEMVVQSRDEIGQLTESFNHMAKELSILVKTLALEKNKHEAVLHNMTDGVLAYDASGHITHANAAAASLLPFDDLENKPLSGLLEQLHLNMKEVQALNPEHVLESTIASGDRYITATCSPYTNQGGVVDGFVIVLQDITKHARLDNMRREFVANVSHELRTPLSSICSYAETLLAGAVDEPEIAKDFLTVIDAEAKRMSLLVTDLLELSHLDDNPTDMGVEVMDLIVIAKMALKQCRVAATEKKQQIIFNEPDEPFFIEAAPNRINQVLVNIISNSIKYSPGDTTITVAMEESERYYRIFIKDEGMGIAKEHINRIFERFYRVDKARSRGLGGTGLGLAIAKEIMEAQGGRITVSSEAGRGTLMVLRFNKLDEGVQP